MQKPMQRFISLLVLLALLLPMIPTTASHLSYADDWVDTGNYFTEKVGWYITGQHGAVKKVDSKINAELADAYEMTFQMTHKFIASPRRTWITPKHAIYTDVYVDGNVVGRAGFHFQPNNLVNYSAGGVRITITKDQFMSAVKDPANSYSGYAQLKQTTGLSDQALDQAIQRSFQLGCGMIFNSWVVVIQSKGPGKYDDKTGMWHNPDQINYVAVDGIGRSGWVIDPDNPSRTFDKAKMTALANGSLTGSPSFTKKYIPTFLNDIQHYAHILEASEKCKLCTAFVHHFYYTKQEDGSETLDNYQTAPIDQTKSYPILQSQNRYQLAEYLTISDATKCLPEALHTFSDAKLLDNHNASGTTATILTKEQLQNPAPLGSELVIKYVKQAEVLPDASDPDVLLSQKRISRQIDLTELGGLKPVTYKWDAVADPLCVLVP